MVYVEQVQIIYSVLYIVWQSTLSENITFAPMESTRQQKFAKQIQRELGDIFLKEGKNFYGNAFVTVTIVRVTSDLGEARVHLSMFKQQDPVALLEQIKKHKSEIRKQLGQRIKDTIHHIPNLVFFIDDSLDYAEKINSVMKDIEIPAETKMNSDDYKEE